MKDALFTVLMVCGVVDFIVGLAMIHPASDFMPARGAMLLMLAGSCVFLCALIMMSFRIDKR